MRWLVDNADPAAERIRVVLDNLSTHKPEALCDTRVFGRELPTRSVATLQTPLSPELHRLYPSPSL
jgi:hypothetical protein